MQRQADTKPTVRIGSAGPPVRELQQSLNGAIGAGLDPDGSFGGMTDGAVRAFQGDRGLAIDGIVGPPRGTPSTRRPRRPRAGEKTDPANDFRIRGLPPDSAQQADRVFFDFASSAVPASEEPKIAALAATPAPLVLHGSSSEEGPGNTALTQQRINSVSVLLAEHGHQAAAHAAEPDGRRRRQDRLPARPWCSWRRSVRRGSTRARVAAGPRPARRPSRVSSIVSTPCSARRSPSWPRRAP